MSLDAYNGVPTSYGRVSVQRVEFPLGEAEITAFLRDKDAYVDTDYVVFRKGEACAIAAIEKGAGQGLFAPITGIAILSLPESTRWVDDPAVDPGNPSALAEKARALGVTSDQTLVVRGLYQHVSFIRRPRPIAIDLFDLSPPEPPRLLDLARRVLAYERFPAIVLNPSLLWIPDRVKHLQGRALLFPCVVEELDAIDRALYLDDRPSREDWVLVGCERGRRIHRRFYGDPDPPLVDLCPKNLFPRTAGALTLMRCCMVDEDFELVDRTAIVPWGADLSAVEKALRALVALAP